MTEALVKTESLVRTEAMSPVLHLHRVHVTHCSLQKANRILQKFSCCSAVALPDSAGGTVNVADSAVGMRWTPLAVAIVVRVGLTCSLCVADGAL